MIKVVSISNMDAPNKKAMVSLFADTKNEVTADASIVGLPDGYAVDFGSSCITADGDIGFMKSNNTWNWVE